MAEAKMTIRTEERIVKEKIEKKLVSLVMTEDEAIALYSLTRAVGGWDNGRRLISAVYHALRETGIPYLRAEGDTNAIDDTRFSSRRLYLTTDSFDTLGEWNPKI